MTCQKSNVAVRQKLILFVYPELDAPASSGIPTKFFNAILGHVVASRPATWRPVIGPNLNSQPTTQLNIATYKLAIHLEGIFWGIL